MDHPPGMRVGIDRMRHLWHRPDFRILLGHGLDFGLGVGNDVVAEQLGLLGQLRLRFERHVFHPERFIELVDHARLKRLLQ